MHKIEQVHGLLIMAITIWLMPTRHELNAVVVRAGNAGSWLAGVGRRTSCRSQNRRGNNASDDSTSSVYLSVRSATGRRRSFTGVRGGATIPESGAGPSRLGSTWITARQDVVLTKIDSARLRWRGRVLGSR